MSSGTNTLTEKDFTKWSSAEVADYVQSKEGLGNYADLFQSQKIDGSVAHRLTDADLKDMGVETIGDRLRILAALENMKKAKERKDREKILWEGEEVLYWSCCDGCATTCCGMCKDDPAQYKLRSNFLEVERPEYNRWGSIKLCFGHSYQIDSIDLSNVTDVDVDGIPPPCLQQCFLCAKSQEHVRLNVGNSDTRQNPGAEILRLHKGEGAEVARKIKNQVELMQQMERS